MVSLQSYDVASVRGLYTSLSDGWTYMNAHDCPQIPERVSAAVARSFRMSTAVARPEPRVGSHARPTVGVPEGQSFLFDARSAIADLCNVSPERVVLGPSLPVLYSALVLAMRPLFRHRSSVVVCNADRPVLTDALARCAEDAQLRWAQTDLATGDVPAWQFGELVDGSTRLVAVPAAHEVLGSVVRVADIADTVRDRSRAWVLADVSAYAPYYLMDFDSFGADILGIDVAELGGPQVAALVFRDEAMFGRLDLSALQLDVSTGLAGGVSAIVDHYARLVEEPGRRKTRRNRLEFSMGLTQRYMRGLRDDLHTFLGTLPSVHIVGVSGEAAEGSHMEHTPRLVFGVHGVPAETVHQRLFANGIVSTPAPTTPLLQDMGVAEMGGAVAVGLGPFNTEVDIEQLIRTVASLA